MSDDQYYTHYGLDEDPFSFVKNEKDFFSTPEIEHRIELIKHLIEFSDRIIVVNGEMGSGKTSLLYYLVNHRDEKWRLCRLSFNEINTVNDFFKQIFNDQAIEYRELDSYASKVASLHDAFEEMQFKGLLPVLFIDDAHFLSIEILKLLFELAITKNNKPALHIVLFSETNIAELINHKNIGFIHTLDLLPFNEEQVTMYIAHRLMSSGYQGEDIISENVIKSIFKASDGLPGMVNELATKALEDPAIQNKSDHWLASIKQYALNPKVTLPLALLLVALLIVYILQTEQTEFDNKLQTKEIKIPKQEKPQQTVNINEELIEPVEEVSTSQKSVSEKTDSKEEADIILLNANGEIISQSQDSSAKLQQQTSSAASEINVVSSKENVIVPDSSEIETLKNIEANDRAKTTPINKDLIGIADANNTEAIIEDITSAAPFSVPKTQVENDKLPEVVEEKTPSKPLEVPPATQNKSVDVVANSQQTPKKAALGRSLRDVTWLKQQDPSDYVLQLMGAYDDQAMNKFIQKNIKDKQKLAKFTTLNQGKTWFVLVYGNYRNRQQAIAAIPNLPAVLRNLKPWPRKIESIQKDLR